MAETLDQALRRARSMLETAGIAEAALDARLLIEHFTGTQRGDALSNPGMPLSADVLRAVDAAVERRIGREPVHRIVGWREFYGLRLRLSEGTLEPRPDTETLVDALLPFVRATADSKGLCRILDLGTGTGAIALALLANEQRASAVGVDASDDALATASLNASAHGLQMRFTALKSDWFEKVTGRFHAIAANPPYIASNEIGMLPAEVRLHDPLRALDGGADGLEAFRAIVGSSERFLEDDGVVALEIGFGQRADVETLIRKAGLTVRAICRDLSGNERAVVFAGQPRP